MQNARKEIFWEKCNFAKKELEEAHARYSSEGAKFDISSYLAIFQAEKGSIVGILSKNWFFDLENCQNEPFRGPKFDPKF